jgi:(p)ppGpp synthase/HD superfamily hydrolase
MILLKRALDSAAFWHRDQKRKYPNAQIPYVSHVAGVVAILARHGWDEEVQAAGALHDTLEDCGVTQGELEKRFGARVASLVALASEEDKSLSWEERKAAYIAKFPSKGPEAQAITLADKIDNLESIVVAARDHGDPWPLFKRGKADQLQRFGALLTAARAIEGHAVLAKMSDELSGALEAARLV